jgi:hypothetical protein
MRSAYRVLIGQPEGKRPPRRPIYRKENNIKMYLREIGEKGGLDSSGSEQGPTFCSCEHSNSLLGFIKCWEFPEQLSNC